MTGIDWRWFNYDLAGWFAIPYAGLGTVYVKVLKIDGIWRVNEMYVDAGEAPVQPSALRAFPLGVLEDAAAETAEFLERMAETHPEVISEVAARRPGPDLRSQLHHLSPASIERWRWVGEPAPLPGESAPQFSYEPGTALTDAFLSDVALAYKWAVRSGRPPAKYLAEEAGVSQRTAQGWIYKARQRGLMEAARKRGRIV